MSEITSEDAPSSLSLQDGWITIPAASTWEIVRVELMPCSDAWAGLYAAHDAGRAAERADVLAKLGEHRAVLLHKCARDIHGALADQVMEMRRIDELIASVSAGLHVSGSSGL